MVLSVLNIKIGFRDTTELYCFVFLSIFLLFFRAIHIVFPSYFLSDAKLPRWGHLKPCIALSLDGVFRGCFARVLTFL